MKRPTVVILTEPPAAGSGPLEHLNAQRHESMARALRQSGVSVTLVGPTSEADPAPLANSDGPDLTRSFTDARAFQRWLGQHQGLPVLVLGSPRLSAWVDKQPCAALIIDSPSAQLPDPASEPLWPALLARCDQVWVANARQAERMGGCLWALGQAAGPPGDIAIVLPPDDLDLASARRSAGRILGTELRDRIGQACAHHDAAPSSRATPAASVPLRSVSARWRAALGQVLGSWIHHRLRRPYHRYLQAKLADRPRPEPGNTAWIVVSRPDVFPTNHGAAVKIERTVWGLSFQVDQAILLTDHRQGYWLYRNGQRRFRPFPLGLRLVGWPRAIDLLRLLARGLPASNAFLYRPLVDYGLRRRLMWLLSRYPVETVQGEFPGHALPAVWAARLFGTRSVLVEHNVEFQRIAEQVPDLSAAIINRLRRFEVETANACSKVITVSERDREQLIAAGVHGALIETIPHGVDLDAFRHSQALDLRSRYRIPADHLLLAYHGIYSYPPNLQAVEELAGQVLPALGRAGRPAAVVAIGPEPPGKSLPGVVFTGPVDDLAGHLKGADLAVIPLRQGGGTRMKILDDFAAGLPVISTAKGMEGIPVKHGRELLIAESTEAIVQSVIDVLDDPALRRRLIEAAGRFIDDLDWRRIAERYVATVRADAWWADNRSL